MNKIYLIFIIVCLTEQLKGNLYEVKPTQVSDGNRVLAILEFASYNVLLCTFNDDVRQGDITINVVSFDPDWENSVEVKLEDPCNMDPSTGEGTLAALFWTSLGIDSCPVAAGTYTMALRRTFNQTGMIKNMFRSVGELITITFELRSKEGYTYFTIFDEVRLMEGSP